MKELKLLKELLKKRQNITVPIIGLFLITGNLGYGIDIYEDYINENVLVEIDKNGLDLKSNNLNITNNGTISALSLEDDFEMRPSDGNGISSEPYSGIGLGNIFNNGIIKGKAANQIQAPEVVGNGIFGANGIGNITNNGLISGTLTTLPNGASGNGIGANNSVGYVRNIGIISGYGDTSLSNSNSGWYSSNGIGIFGRDRVILEGVNNRGIIEGVNHFDRLGSSGNGIYSRSSGLGKVVEIINSGVIRAISTKGLYFQGENGNGIYSSHEIGNITNKGIVSGDSTILSTANSGNGVIAKVNIETITNDGVISGFSTDTDSNSGNGINSSDAGRITNSGVIKGSNQGIKGIGSSTNNGILAGQIITDSAYTNNGIAITLDNTGNITNIENGNAGIIAGKTVLNGNINIAGNDSSTSALATGANYDNYIINGAGTDKGALIVDENTELTNSIINGYNTAVYIESEKTLTATDTIFNGGGLKNDVAVIKGNDGDNTLNIFGNSIINGTVELGNGTNTLTIANTVQINGSLAGGDGAEDTLNLGEVQTAKATASPNLNILHDINGFESINTNGNITLFETVKINSGDITLESGDLVLRVDPTITIDGKVAGHALYDHVGTLSTTGGTLIIGANGLSEGTIIGMNGTTIFNGDAAPKDEFDSKYEEYHKLLATNSLVSTAILTTDGDIQLKIKDFLELPVQPEIGGDLPEIGVTPPIEPPVNPEPPIEPPVEPPIVMDSFLYEKLNKVYQSIVTAGEIGNLANTTLLEDKTYNESLGELLAILDQIYANNPYSYTLKSSRDSLKLFEDNLSYLTIKPKKDEVIVQGKAIYTGVKNDSGASGKNYYGFDTNHRNYKTTTNTVGGLATFEYGLSDDTSVGFVFGGNNQDVKFKGSSKIKGNSLYLGTFAKTDIKNFKFMSGVGYQYTSADADRKISNRYDSFSTGDKYDINSLNAFVEAKYVYNAEQDWTVEPKVRLSYYYIDQDKVNEGYTPGQISMRTDSVNSNTADVEIGVDFVKSLYLNNGKLKNILSLGVINTIGDKSKELNGYILGKEKDGKKFDIQGVELPKISGKVSYNLELEQTNGMIYTAGVSLEFAKDYNRNVNATVGMGYKF